MTRRLTRAALSPPPSPAPRRGSAPIRAVPFEHDGHNLMRYRPDAVSAAILSVAGPGRVRGRHDAGRLHAGAPRPRHHARDVHGPGRSRRTRSPSGPSDPAALRPTAASRSSARPSTARRRSPPSTTRVSCGSSRSPGPRSAGRPSPRPFLSADTYPNRSMFEGMSPEAVARLVREPVHAAGRAGFWGLDSAAPLVAGTYVAARGGGRRRADGGRPRPRRRAGRLRPVPAARPSRGALDVRRLLLLQQRGDRGRGDRPRRPASASRSSTSTTTTATAASRSSGGAATSATSRSTPTRSAHYPYFLGRADETGRGRRGRGEPQHPAAGRGDRRGLPRGDGPGARGDRRGARLDRRRLARLRHLRPRPDRRLRADDGASTTRSAAGSAALGRRLVILQEGGYHRPSLGENARAWLRGAEGRPFDPLPAGGFGESGAVAG